MDDQEDLNNKKYGDWGDDSVWQHDAFWERIRSDFPVLFRDIEGKKIMYLDSTCMALKPKPIVEAMNYYYYNLGVCAGRSGHALGHETTILCDMARRKMARFINARYKHEVIWIRNTTEGLNLVANALNFKEGDNVVTSLLEHHSGILPFHKLHTQGKVGLKIVEPNDEGIFDMEAWENAIDDNTRLVSVVHASNLTGSITPVEEIAKIAHDHGAYVVVDDAQYAPHRQIDVQHGAVDSSLRGCPDFRIFSVHKMCGPTGMGVLYGKAELMDDPEIMDTFLVGGGTILDVGYEDGMVHPKYDGIPRKYEAGLQNYAGIIGAGATVDYLNWVGMKNIEHREEYLTTMLLRRLGEIPDIDIIGPKDPKKRVALATFKIGEIPSTEIADYLHNQVPGYRIMLRYGAHCVNPFLHNLGIHPNPAIQGTIRASFYLYNTPHEVEVLAESLEKYIKDEVLGG